MRGRCGRARARGRGRVREHVRGCGGRIRARGCVRGSVREREHCCGRVREHENCCGGLQLWCSQNARGYSRNCVHSPSYAHEHNLIHNLKQRL